MTTVDIVFGTALLAMLAAIAVIDVRTMAIPDWLNIGLAGSGLGYQAVASKAFPLGALAFAILVFASFWLVRYGYQRLRGVVGLGYGDVKMAGASALWFSPWNLPLFLMASSVSALVFVLAAQARGGGFQVSAKIPFGPFLGVGLAMTWLLERSQFATFVPNGG